MSDTTTKTGPTCHCLSQGGEARFVSYDTSGTTPKQYHAIEVKSGDGKHLPLPQGSANVVHVFGKLGPISSWDKFWASSPVINNGDELKVQYANDREGDWSVYLNGNEVSQGQFQ